MQNKYVRDTHIFASVMMKFYELQFFVHEEDYLLLHVPILKMQLLWHGPHSNWFSLCWKFCWSTFLSTLRQQTDNASVWSRQDCAIYMQFAFGILTQWCSYMKGFLNRGFWDHLSFEPIVPSLCPRCQNRRAPLGTPSKVHRGNRKHNMGCV